MTLQISRGPVRTLFGLLGLLGIVWLWATLLLLAQPHPGLGLRADGAFVRLATPPADSAIPTGVRVVSLARPGDEPFAIEPTDLIEEPDFFDTYEEMQRFFARQGELRTLIDERFVLAWTSDADGSGGQIEISPGDRRLADLPATFWFQLACGSVASVIGLWVLLLSPQAWSARMLALTGFAYLLITVPAAIYSSRAIALEPTLFRLLSATNHLGAILFGCGLVTLMWSYPRPLGVPRWLLLPFAVYLPWWLADTARLAPDQTWGSRIAIMSQMLIAIGLGVYQWRRSRGDPLARAGLRWVLLSALVGSGLFVFIVVGSQLLGSFPPMPQGYALGFFLVMFVGLALGVGRYRLFELDRWAYQVLLWVGGAMLVLLLDGLLITVLHVAPSPALFISLLASGWLYFPMRQWLLLRFTRGESGAEEALSDLLALALVADPDERGAEWRELLRARFQPARITPEEASGATRVLDDGLGLLVPAHNGCPGLRLHLRDAGRSLFRRADAELVDALVKLLAQTLVRRAALDEAAQAERQRIAQDLHDDLGSRLLMMIHRSEQPELATLAREAMADLRTILSAIDGPGIPLADLLADCRAETAQRCEASGTRLDWKVDTEIPDTWLSSQLRSTLSRCLRELVTNALKHARPDVLEVTLAARDGRLRIGLCHPLRDTAVQEWQSGRGLRGVHRRVESLRGRFAIERTPGESITAILEVPL